MIHCVELKLKLGVIDCEKFSSVKVIVSTQHCLIRSGDSKCDHINMIILATNFLN